MQQGEPVVGSYSRASVAAGRSLVSHSSYCPFSAVPWPPFLLLDRTGKEESLICDCDPRSAHPNVLLGAFAVCFHPGRVLAVGSAFSTGWEQLLAVPQESLPQAVA